MATNPTTLRLLLRTTKPSLALRAEAELELRRREQIRIDAMREERLSQADQILRWQKDPVLYARERLGLTLTPDQEEVCYSVRDNRRTVAMASHAVGKSFIAAVLVLWWYHCWGEHIAYITGPNWRKALDNTFKQVKLMTNEKRLGGRILEGWLKDPDKVKEPVHNVQVINAEKGEGFQGEHSAPILIVIDEGVGVPKHIWEALVGLMTNPNCRVLAIGNPTDQSTNFGDICDSPLWEVFSMSGLDHPNIRMQIEGKAPAFPLAVQLLWIKEMIEDNCDVIPDKIADAFEFWSIEDVTDALNGIDVSRRPKVWYKPNGQFQGRVLGVFPTEASDKVIPSGWMVGCPVQPIHVDHIIAIGCDSARFGDDRSCAVARVGACTLMMRVVRHFDNLAVAEMIRTMVEDTLMMLDLDPVNDRARVRINIDTTGGLGTGPYDILKAEGYNVVGINSSSKKVMQPEYYPNIRSELWFDVRDKFRRGRIDMSRLPKQQQRELKKELGQPAYKPRSGMKVVEDKSETKKNLGASPDLADGFNLAYYEAPIDTSGIMIEEFFV